MKMIELGALVLAIVFALITWRTGVGGLSSYRAGSEYMLTGASEWWVYAAMTPPFALTSLIGLRQALFGFNFETEQRA